MSACSIVIRAYNEEEHIGRLLSGILQQTVKDVQIILVDSGSTDATVAIATRYPVDVVKIKPQDFTFGRSLNLGISQARSDLVVIASAHVYPVYPDWLESMLKPFDNPRVALTYGKQRTSQSSKFSEKQVWQQWYPDQPRPSQKYPFCNNANASIRKTLWEQRPYDETLSGLEDLEWARWSQDQGYEIVYVPEAEVIHVHNETWRGIYNRYRREAMAFKQIYPQEKFDFVDFARLLFVNVVNDFKAASKKHVLKTKWSQIAAYRWNQFLGTYRGYRQSGMFSWELRRTFYYPSLNHAVTSPQKERTIAPIRYHDSYKRNSSLSQDPKEEGS